MTDKKARYDEKAKARTMRYQKNKREMLNLNLPIGTKERWREQAAKAGEKSVSAYIIRLIEEDSRNYI